MDYEKIMKERKLYINYSNQIAGNDNYRIVYNQAIDSIKTWASHDLKSYLTERENKWVLDSLICFNEKIDKFIAVIAHQNIVFKDIEADGLTYLYGVKINESWYFFKGPYLALPRNFYQKDTKIPLSFSILKAIAMDEIFSGYLKENRQTGKWEINRGYFADLASNAWCMTCNTYKTPAQWDSIYLDLVKKNWSSRDTTDKRPIQ